LGFLISLLCTNVFIHVSALRIPIKQAEVVKRASAGALVKSVSLAGAGNSDLGSVGDIRVIDCTIILL